MDTWFDQWQTPTTGPWTGGITGEGTDPHTMGSTAPVWSNLGPSDSLDAPTQPGDPGSTQPGSPQETDQQRYQRFQRDYWAPDREQVLAQMLAAMGGGTPETTPGGPSGTPPAGGAPGAGGSLYGNANAFRDAWFASGGKTTTDLANFVKAHPEFGATVTGSKGSKVLFPNGQAFQGVRSSGINGGIGPAWDDLSGGDGASGGAAPGMNSTLLDPYPGQYTLPSLQEFMKSPLAKAGFKQGQEAIQTSAAARGTLLTGGTLKDLADFGQQNAMNNYSNLANLNMGAQGFNRDSFWGNQDRPFDKLYRLSDLGFRSASA